MTLYDTSFLHPFAASSKVKFTTALTSLPLLGAFGLALLRELNPPPKKLLNISPMSKSTPNGLPPQEDAPA